MTGYVNFITMARIPLFPVTPATFTAFGIAYCWTGRSALSIPGILSAIRHYADDAIEAGDAPLGRDILGNPRPLVCVSDARANRIMRGLSRVFPPSSYQKAPMLLEYLTAIWEKGDSTSWEFLRDRAWQAIAHAGLFRIGELLALTWRDVELVRDRAGRVAEARFTIVSAKTSDPTNPVTHGRQMARVTRLPAKSAAWCALSHFLDYGVQSGAISGDSDAAEEKWASAPLFPVRRVSASEIASGNFPRSINRDETTSITRCGLVSIGFSEPAAKEFANHSFRSGGATDLRACGVSIEEIAERGRWTSDAVYVYFRDSERAPPRSDGLCPGVDALQNAIRRGAAQTAPKPKRPAPSRPVEETLPALGGKVGRAATAVGAGAGVGAGTVVDPDHADASDIGGDDDGAAGRPGRSPGSQLPPVFARSPLLWSLLDDARSGLPASRSGSTANAWIDAEAAKQEAGEELDEVQLFGYREGVGIPTPDAVFSPPPSPPPRGGSGRADVGAGAGGADRPDDSTDPRPHKWTAGTAIQWSATGATGKIVGPRGWNPDGDPLYLVEWTPPWTPTVHGESSLNDYAVRTRVTRSGRQFAEAGVS
jgi:integrase